MPQTRSNGGAGGKEQPKPPSKRKAADSETDQNGSSKSRRKSDGGSSSEQPPSGQSGADKKLKGDDIETHETGNNENDADAPSEVPWHVTEKGFIYWLYRPKVVAADKAETASAESLDEVQSTFMVLVPRASESDTAPASSAEKKENEEGDKREPPNPTTYRLISLGKKRMPSPEAAIASGSEPGGIGGRHSEAIWATVADIGADLNNLAQGMGEERYTTKTRGDRVKPAARPAGRGHYALSIKTTDPASSREVRLTYDISHPSSNEFGAVQKELGLHPSSSILVQMRNPTLAPTGPDALAAGLPEDKRAKLTKGELEENFGGDVKSKGNRYARPEQPSLLDRQGVELLLIKREKQEKEGLQGLGDEQNRALADLAERDQERLSDEAVLKELKLSGQDVKVEPLSGEWA
ncbi:uncharacterized protein PAN0_001d0469 [Moesziomyces antarcticus]|uniref:Uncharacterized protein n=1 Tax=Pseudozyma antarctica TaxID=84753 RepID=A0A5C3FF22_PSEA2|nr:uncharacterized protein PAN0_001d0469 [Moesziomyces antarcticus]GAK62270.1 conserved hypothetical protein [Moesziomyces antarcticus]SPO42810.1 uncharacterized protein PSANT_00493 [Moesziomyces antarcticus]